MLVGYNRVGIKKIIFRLLFVWSYVGVLIYSIYTLSDTWWYQNIIFYQQKYSIYFFIAIFSALPLPFFPKNIELPSDFVNVYLYLVTFIPAVVVPYFINSEDHFNENYIYFLIVFLICFIYLLLNKRTKPTIIGSLIKPVSLKYYIPLIYVFYGFAIIILVTTFGFKFTIPSLDDVYDVRAQYKEISKGSLLSRYLVGWMGYIVNIFVFLIALKKKNRSLLLFTIVFQFYIFSIMALKSHLATMLLVFIIYIFFTRNKTISFDKFFISLITFVISLPIIDFFLDGILLQTLITRRIFIVPSQLTYYHFEYFVERPKTFWAQSFMGRIVDYPYKMKPPNIIGLEYFNRPDMTAVVNFFMEGFTAMSYFGIFLVTTLFKYLIKQVDYVYVYRAKKNRLIIVLLFVFFNILNSTSIFTFILTHGYLIFFLLLFITPWKKLFKTPL